VVNPNPEEIEAFRKRREREEAQRRADSQEASSPALTLEGQRIEVVGNIGSLSDAEETIRLGGEGVGLLRSEFLFMNRATPPDEDEQTNVYSAIGEAISVFSKWAASESPATAFTIYGVVERALIPFGLHHIWNVPFFFEVGQYVDAAGKVIHGELNRFAAGDPTAGNLAGGYLFKMWGLPAAALAIWHCAKPEQKARVGGIMVSAALTSFLTGITEPIEFSFLFVAPTLYGMHALLAGLAFFHLCFFWNQARNDFFPWVDRFHRSFPQVFQCSVVIGYRTIMGRLIFHFFSNRDSQIRHQDPLSGSRGNRGRSYGFHRR